MRLGNVGQVLLHSFCLGIDAEKGIGGRCDIVSYRTGFKTVAKNRSSVSRMKASAPTEEVRGAQRRKETKTKSAAEESVF